MSVWTHVVAVFRFDGVLVDDVFTNYPDWDVVVGRVIHEGDWYSDYDRRKIEEDWDAYDEDPSSFVPTGSEGSLHKVVWVNPDPSHADHYTVTVFGDLRDFEDVEAIHEWFQKVCKHCLVRQAVCTCNVDGFTNAGNYVWTNTWNDDETWEPKQ